MTVISIHLSKLTASSVNVRKIGGSIIGDLAANICAVGVLSSLVVEDAGKGKYEVVAGGRRTLATRHFHHTLEGSLAAKINATGSITQGSRFAGRKAYDAMESHREGWVKALPKAQADLWQWVRDADRSMKADLLAYLVASSVNVVQERGAAAITNGHQVHEALGLDMADWWEPTADSYLSRVSKAKVLEALVEAGVKESQITGAAAMKKGALAPAAETMLAGKRWLPSPLRLPEATPVAANDAGAEPDDLEDGA